jgi:hypothetical protein
VDLVCDKEGAVFIIRWLRWLYGCDHEWKKKIDFPFDGGIQRQFVCSKCHDVIYVRID